MFWKDELTDKAAMKIANSISRLQNGFAMFMNKRTKNISVRVWKVLVVVFAAGWGTLSVYFIVNAFENKIVKKYKGSSIQFIVKPARSDSLVLMEEIYKQRHKK